MFRATSLHYDPLRERAGRDRRRGRAISWGSDPDAGGRSRERLRPGRGPGSTAGQRRGIPHPAAPETRRSLRSRVSPDDDDDGRDRRAQQNNQLRYLLSRAPTPWTRKTLLSKASADDDDDDRDQRAHPNHPNNHDGDYLSDEDDWGMSAGLSSTRQASFLEQAAAGERRPSVDGGREYAFESSDDGYYESEQRGKSPGTTTLADKDGDEADNASASSQKEEAVNAYRGCLKKCVGVCLVVALATGLLLQEKEEGAKEGGTVGMATTETALVKVEDAESERYAAGHLAVKQREEAVIAAFQPVWFSAAQGWSGGSYTEGILFCESYHHMFLCPLEAYCPHGPARPPLPGSMVLDPYGAEEWAPANGPLNTWIQIGTLDGDESTRCTLPHNTLGEQPQWGIKGDRTEVKHHILCCRM